MVMTSRSSTSCCTCTAGRRRGGGSRSYGASRRPDPAAFFNAPPCLSPIQKKVGSAGPSRRGAPIEARLDGSPELTLNVNAPCRHRTHADRIVYRPIQPVRYRSKYTDDSVDERKSKGFELVRVHHQTLTRMFCDDPDGDYLDIDDIRCVWEEFVDALRDATAKSDDPPPAPTSMQYAEVEGPVMKRSPSFAKLVKDLSTEASAPASPTIERVSGKGMILGVGCSSRDNSARGGSEYFRRMQAEKGKGPDGAKIMEQLAAKGLTRRLSGTFDAGAQ